MKRVEAIFSPVHLEGVVERLRMIGTHGLTLHELRVLAAEPRRRSYRGIEVLSDLEDAVRIDVVTPDSHVQSVINAITLIIGRGKPPDGYIYVAPVEEAIRIRTGETGEDAL